jgi:hypothetical protein
MKTDPIAVRKAMQVIADHQSAGTLLSAMEQLGVQRSQAEQLWKVNRLAILFWREYVKAGGLVLDPLLWNIGAGAEVVMDDAVADALTHGKDGSKAAANFLYISGTSSDIMRVDIDHMVDEDTDFGEHITNVFTDSINLAFRSVQDIISPG